MIRLLYWTTREYHACQDMAEAPHTRLADVLHHHCEVANSTCMVVYLTSMSAQDAVKQVLCVTLYHVAERWSKESLVLAFEYHTGSL